MGALNEVVTRWLYTGQPERLESTLPGLRQLLLRSVGYPIERETAESAVEMPRRST
jgi:hypothetical protein